MQCFGTPAGILLLTLSLTSTHTLISAWPSAPPNSTARNSLRLLTAGNETSSGSSDLSIPTIPGFRTEINYFPTQPLWDYEMCDNVISAMLHLSTHSWEAVIASFDVVTRPAFRCELVASLLPHFRPSRVRTKHLILALYALGRDFGRARRWEQVFESFYVNQDRFGIVGIQITSPETLGNVKSVNENSHDHFIQNSTLADETGVFIDPGDTNFQIHYTRHIRESVDPVDVFLTFIDALADAISHDTSATGAKVNSTNDLPSALRLQIESASRGQRPILRWGQCVQTIGLLWRSLTGAHGFFEALTFQIEYAGEEIGSGSLREDRPAGGGSTSTGK